MLQLRETGRRFLGVLCLASAASSMGQAVGVNEGKWDLYTFIGTPAYSTVVKGLNTADAQFRATVNIVETVPDNHVDNAFPVGIETRLRDNKDSFSIGNSLPRYTIGGLFDAVSEFATPFTKAGGAIGVQGRAFSLVSNWSDSVTAAKRDFFASSGNVTFTDPFPTGSQFKVFSGTMLNAVGGSFAVTADNGHFYDVATSYTAYSIRNASGVRSSYSTGGAPSPVSSATSGPDQGVLGPFGSLTERFDGFLVTTVLGAKTSSQTPGSGYNGSFDRIMDWNGLRVTAPVKKVKADANLANQQEYANKAFGTATGVKIEAPQAPTGSAGNVSPASYLGLLVNAKSEFNGPVKMTDSLTVIPRSTAPPNPQDGTLWMKDTGVLAVCFGGSWKNINTTP